MKKSTALIVLGVLLGTLTLPGGETSRSGPTDRERSAARRSAREVGKALDRLAATVSEYGSIHVSPPLLSEAGEDFKFDLRRGATNYFDEAKREVDANTAFFQQTVQSFGFGAAAQMDPTMTAAGLEKLRSYYGDQARRGLKQGLGDAALQQRLDAELAAAEQLTNAVERLAAIAAARERFATNFVAPEAAPEFPTAGQQSLPGAPSGLVQRPTDLAQVFAGDGKFAGFLGLLGHAPAPTLNNRVAIGRAAGDVATEAIFRLLGQPERAAELTGRSVVFGVVEVSVDPGWRTGRDYAADVSVLVKYEYHPARRQVVRQMLLDKALPLEVRQQLAVDVGEEFDPEVFETLGVRNMTLSQVAGMLPGSRPKLPLFLTLDTGGSTNSPYPSRNRPLVFAVSPFSDLETMDQGSSLRRQDELAISLSFALRYYGMAGQAEAFEKFVRSRQSDARSRSAVAPITSYAQGGMVGFQVGPRFQAIADPTQKKQKPGYVLGRQAFPALLVFGLDPLDLYPKIKAGPDGRWEAFECHLRLEQIPSWRPLKQGGFLAPSHPRLKEHEKLLMSLELSEARSGLEALPANTRSHLLSVLPVLDARTTVLKAHAFGSATTLAALSHDVTVPVRRPPQPGFPEVRETIPTRFELQGTNKTVRLALLGDNLEHLDLPGIQEYQGNATVRPAPTSDGHAVLLDVTVEAPGTLVFKLPVKHQELRLSGPVILTSPPIVVTRPKTPEPPQPSSTEAVLRTREQRGAAAGSVERTIEVSPSAPAERVAAALEVLKTDAARSGGTNTTSANVNVQVEAHDHGRP